MKLDYEKYIRTRVDPGELPVECLEAYAKDRREGVPVAIGKHPKTGWFVIWSAGQGPGLGWSEKPIDFVPHVPGKTERKLMKIVEEE